MRQKWPLKIYKTGTEYRTLFINSIRIKLATRNIHRKNLCRSARNFCSISSGGPARQQEKYRSLIYRQTCLMNQKKIQDPWPLGRPWTPPRPTWTSDHPLWPPSAQKFDSDDFAFLQNLSILSRSREMCYILFYNVSPQNLTNRRNSIARRTVDLRWMIEHQPTFILRWSCYSLNSPA